MEQTETVSQESGDRERDRILSRILSTLRNELEKKDTQNHIKCFFDPVMLYLLKSVQPYIILVIVLLTLLVMSQAFIALKLYGDALRSFIKRE